MTSFLSLSLSLSLICFSYFCHLAEVFLQFSRKTYSCSKRNGPESCCNSWSRSWVGKAWDAIGKGKEGDHNGPLNSAGRSVCFINFWYIQTKLHGLVHAWDQPSLRVGGGWGMARFLNKRANSDSRVGVRGGRGTWGALGAQSPTLVLLQSAMATETVPVC
jgi:hypothetical protein